MMNFIRTQFALITLIMFGFHFGCVTESRNDEHGSPDTKMAEKHATDKSFGFQQEPSALMNGTVRAICYSGFRKGQHPDRGDGAVNPSYDEILEDLNILEAAGFTLIRMYDSGQNTQMVLKVIEERQLPFKVLLGIWLKAEISNHVNCGWLDKPIPDEILMANKRENASELDRGIDLANRFPDLISAVAVGNEALVSWNDHMVGEETIITYVKQVKQAIQQPVTVADNYKWWALHGENLAKIVDFVAIQVYPVWEGQDIDDALSYTAMCILEVKNTIPESRLVISEAGWATVSSEFGARASEKIQARYFQELYDWAKTMNYTVFFFEAFDEPWKGQTNNPLGAEKHWGIYDENRQPKAVMKNRGSE